VNFTACKIAFETNATNLELYSYTGLTPNLPLGPGRPYLISEQGCRTLCGTGADKYPWATAANTITTWVLPIIGLLLQAPFESNQIAKTFLATCRWIGAPIASLSYIFWNIKITGKCAITVDMAVDYNAFPGPGSEFSQLRDSFYILSVMNQYALSTELEHAGSSSTERFLRVALFDNDLVLANPSKGMVHRREKLAASLRSGRKRGVVPIFISTLWFLLSLAISIHAAFGNLGVNATAHNLAIGLLLGWLPVLTLSSITDRSPGSADDVRRKLNRFLSHVRQGLQANTTNPRYKSIQLPAYSHSDNYHYFTSFCGQARSRWHYGIAHAILTGTEDAFAAAHGRNWTAHHNARALLICAPPATRHSNIWFDFRELWQIMGATALVGCSIFGSFIISYFTPTVGLGCRSGGYLIFFVITLAHFLAESAVWWIFPRPSKLRERIGWAFTVMEMVNTAWLIYILSAQTFGLYQTCACWSSSWGIRGGGGYINFGTSAYYKAHIIAVYWTTGTILSSLAMGAGFLYVVAEWCTQSHMWTEDYGDAMAGLKATRRFKK
ncbi:hypothetical protein P167DRAFT_466018, partial [Morchella conica CCBAS932]